jgi:hypothetical protein
VRPWIQSSVLKKKGGGGRKKTVLKERKLGVGSSKGLLLLLLLINLCWVHQAEKREDANKYNQNKGRDITNNFIETKRL